MNGHQTDNEQALNGCRMDIEQNGMGTGGPFNGPLMGRFFDTYCTLNAFTVFSHSSPLFSQGLRKKTVAPGAVGLDDHLRGSGSTDLFGSADAIVKHVLEVRGGREVGGTVHVQCTVHVYVHVQ